MCYKSLIMVIYCIRKINFLTIIIPTSKCVSILWCLWFIINYSSIIFINIRNSTSRSSKLNSIFINCPWSCNCCVFSWHWIRNILIPMNCISSLCPTWFINTWCRRIIISCTYYILISTIRIFECNLITINCPISINSLTICRHCCWNWFIPTGKCVSSLCRISWWRYICIIFLCNIRNWSSSICIEVNCILIYSPLRCNSHIITRHFCWDCFIPTNKCVSFFSRISWCCYISTIFSCNYIICFSIILNKRNCVSISLIINPYYSISISINILLITCYIST